MLPFKYEAYFVVPAILIGTFVLRGVFVSEVYNQHAPVVTESVPLDPDSYLEAQVLGLDRKNTAPHISATVQDTSHFLQGHFKGNDFQWYSTNALGDTIYIPLLLTRAGTFEVLAQFARSADFGIIKVSLNGKVVLEELNLFSETANATGSIPLGVYALSEENMIQIEVTGTDPQSKEPRYQCALDGILLREIKAATPDL